MNPCSIVAALCLIGSLPAQQPVSEPADVSLVTVTAKSDHLELRRGRDLGVTMTITAGTIGAYFPYFFGDLVATFQAGFSVDIYTLQGDRASTASKGCAIDY